MQTEIETAKKQLNDYAKNNAELLTTMNNKREIARIAEVTQLQSNEERTNQIRGTWTTPTSS